MNDWVQRGARGRGVLLTLLVLVGCGKDTIFDNVRQPLSPVDAGAQVSSGCGNGSVESGEQCEPPSTQSCDESCRAIPPGCGDGQQTEKECDDGNRVSGDGCSSTCTLEACGNGRVDSGEECEPPGSARCDQSCQLVETEGCGNGVLEPGEECEDGNTSSGDGCSSACREEVCGNGRVDPGEECEPPGAPSCSAACRVILPAAASCGNGVLEPPEECDDGNRLFGDGCTGECLLVQCGNGRVDRGPILSGELCDPPEPGYCDNQCRLLVPVCGDGLTVPPKEQCDDRNVLDGDGCNNRCQLEVCGNTVLDAGEECEPPSTPFCDTLCRSIAPPACGNGRREATEECDDGNRLRADGCDHLCRLEACGNGRIDPGEDCELPNVGDCDAQCRQRRVVCGDGERHASEECDDGNLAFGDGCNGRCEVETCGNGRIDHALECEPPGTAVCNAECRPRRCGDGVLDAGEQCEDGNLEDGDGCSGDCRIEACGNGRLDPGTGEQCEPPGTEICDADCRMTPAGIASAVSLPAQCGDGQLSEPEECEPASGARCLGNCTLLQTRCGDGRVQGAEQCDPPNGATCDLQCRAISCGNDTVESPEQCDPPAPDLCTAHCLRMDALPVTCGDGLRQGMEECDPPNGATGCSAACKRAVCGDAQREAAEQCDPPDGVNCAADCSLIQPLCGDGKVEGAEQCDPPGGVCMEDCSVSDALPECQRCMARTCRAQGAGEDLFSACFSLDGVAEAGPAQGTPLRDVCAAAVECIRQTGCATEAIGRGNPNPAACYCGKQVLSTSLLQPEAPVRECRDGTTEARGACRAAFEAAAESTLPEVVLAALDAEMGRALGAALRIMTECGYADAPAGCASDCAIVSSCGNGVLEAGEICDPSWNPGSPDGVDPYCAPAACTILPCGNGVVDVGETCDVLDPYTSTHCDATCQLIADCGDGVKQVTEGCDPGESGPWSHCCPPEDVQAADTPAVAACEGKSACQVPSICGNGIVEGLEQCDSPDRNVCSAECESSDACAACTRAGFPQEGAEQANAYEKCLGTGSDVGFKNRCLDTLNCFAGSECDEIGGVKQCLCGTQSDLFCVAIGGDGPCANAITENANCNSPELTIPVPQCAGERSLDLEYPAGVAGQIIQFRRAHCAEECGY